MLVLTRYVDEKLRNKASFGSKQSRTGDADVSSFIMLIKSHLHDLTSSENVNLKKIPVDHYHDANQYSVAALARKTTRKKSDIQELKQVLLDTIQSTDRHFDAHIPGLPRKNQGKREEIPR